MVQHDVAQLAPHPHRLELSGSPRSLAWPDLCANCGAQASERIAVRKVFLYQYDERPNKYRVEQARVPFCARCAAEHRATAPHLSPARLFVTYLLTPLVIPVVGGIWGMSVALPIALRETGQSRLVGMAIVAFFALCAVLGVVGAVTGTRIRRVLPQTEVTRACDFSQDVSEALEAERHVYTLRNPAFAAALADANAGRRWTRQKRAAARTRRIVAYTLLAVGAAGWWVWDTYFR